MIGKFLKYILPCLLALIVVSCVDDDITTDTTIIQPNPQEIISTNLFGKVSTADGQSAAGALVTLVTHTGEETISADTDGNFKFFQIQNPGPSAYIKVNHPGHFTGYRRLSVLKDNYNYTEIALLARTLQGRVESAVGGTASTAEGMEVTLQGGGFVDANGAPYRGTVNVYMAYLDPTDPDLAARMIGDLSGRSDEGRDVSLITYGMVHVELESPSGEPLQIDPAMPATLNYPVPNDILSRAPITIPLWYYSEDLGTWVEEGEARLEGSQYVGQVTHFSAWNVDFLQDPIDISGCVDIESPALRNMGVAGARLQIFVCSDLIGTKGGWLCPDGKFLFYNFPRGEAFTLKILDECGNEVYRMDFGPFGESTDLGTITIPQPVSGTATVSGQVTDCDGNPVTDGHVRAVTGDGDVLIAPIDSGRYEFLLVYCDADPISLDLVAVDYAGLEQSTTIQLTVGPDDIVDEDLVACGEEIVEFIRIQSDGLFDETIVGTPNITQIENDTIVYFNLGYSNVFGQDSLGNVRGEVSIAVENVAVDGIGTYEISRFDFFRFEPNQTYTYANPSQGVSLSPMTLEITQYSDVPGELVKGTFSGQAVESSNQIPGSVVPITGSFSYIVP